MDDDEFVTDVEGNQRLRPVWSHQIYSRHLAVRWETQHRELPVIGDLRRLKLAGALHLVVHVARPFDDPMIERSEEHTSELQSLMRISYAVFYLTKQKNKVLYKYNTVKY